jgi:hypothetical protein
MSQHLTRALLTRGVVGTLFTMIVVTTVLFVAAHHLAG